MTKRKAEELGFFGEPFVLIGALGYLAIVLPLYLQKPKALAPAEVAKKITLDNK